MRAVDPARCDEHGYTEEPYETTTITAWVEWCDVVGLNAEPAVLEAEQTVLKAEPAVLEARLRGETFARVASSSRQDGADLKLTFDWRRADPGETFVIQLSAGTLLQHLHILRPIEQLSLSRLLITPSNPWPRAPGIARVHEFADCADPVHRRLHPITHAPWQLPSLRIDRGFGLEVELLTPAPSISRSASLLKLAGSKQDAWQSACASDHAPAHAHMQSTP